MSLIHIQDLSKQFKVLNCREGIGGAFRDLFSGDYRTVEAVAGISFDIEAGEIVGYIGPERRREVHHNQDDDRHPQAVERGTASERTRALR